MRFTARFKLNGTLHAFMLGEAKVFSPRSTAIQPQILQRRKWSILFMYFSISVFTDGTCSLIRIQLITPQQTLIK